MSTVVFQPDQCLPRDPAGWGRWLTSHSYEHEDLRIACLGLTKPIIIPSYDLLGWRDDPQFVQNWLQTHEEIHEELRAITGVGGTDLSLVDLTKDDEWYVWLDDHSTEHESFRSVLNAG